MLDAIIVGAGAAGIAAACALRKAGCNVEILEARDRIGGRAVVREIDGRPIDLGAHWMHVAERNPLVPLANDLGIATTRARQDIPIYADGRRISDDEARIFADGWRRLDDSIARALASGGDRSIGELLPNLGEWTDMLAFNVGLYCGAPVEELSAKDLDRNEDGSNLFPHGGYGALIAALGSESTIRLDRAVTRIRSESDCVVVDARTEAFEARAAIVTIPTSLLARHTITFEPMLPDAVRRAIQSFKPGAYEHAIVRWPASPFHADGADRLTLFRGDRMRGAAMLTCIDGGDLHYFELGGAFRRLWKNGDERTKRRYVRDFLSSQFGRAANDAEILCVTDWWNDPWSMGSWSTLGPGDWRGRDALRDHAADRIRFAGEATSLTQPSTVGGAWLEGERAAKSVLDLELS